MCTGPESNKRKLVPPGFGMDCEIKTQKGSSILLEFSASDDLISFKRTVEEESLAVDETSLWYGRCIGSKKMGFEQRTPLMIASMFGSISAVKYLIERDGSIDVNRVCGSDRVTALHLAAAGGSPASPEIVKLLLDASADVNCVDANGNRPGDVISPAMRRFGGLKMKILDMLLNKGEEKFDFFSSDCEELHNQQVTEKKEYPIDPSMPDIKNGIFGTDEFRMYSFKVKPCSRAYSHDWTECPFVHPGENARRRDPRKYHYSCVPCPEFRKGACRQGDACDYAHGVFECWLHPAQYRTRLCKDETGCTRRVCFFAHKPDELRPLYASTGSAIPSPRSSSSPVGSFELGSMGPLSLSLPGSASSSSMLMIPTSTPPMSPSSNGGAAALWQNGIPPALQLPGSRLKTALSARDFDLEMDIAGLESAHQQQLIDEISNLSNLSGRANVLAAALASSAGSRSGKFSRAASGGLLTPSNLEDVFGSIDPSSISQLQALKSAQFQSPLRHSGYGGISSSPVRVSTPSSFGLDSSLSAAAAVMNSRSAAFAKRSQSFIDRSTVNRPPGIAPNSAMMSDWSSPNGKLDWGIQGEELNKFKKSASFAFRNSGIPPASNAPTATIDEPDVSWVHSLVKENPSQQYNHHLNGEFHPSEMMSPWAEQMYMEQEQMVA
ncbi:zinc finger CCCH domain-containing protein 29-like [Tasmannia lanceolata]|uniref:zinc finger CCCH domain-containing protein 29-like n=1 Tax=Tasmannia lanceolata TaxID=3420 RepID=UPI00406322A8